MELGVKKHRGHDEKYLKETEDAEQIVYLMHFSKELVFEAEKVAFEEGIRLNEQNKGVKSKLNRFFELIMSIFLRFILIVGDIIDDQDEY